MKLHRLVSFAALLAMSFQAHAASLSDWKITQDRWSARDEQNFSDFVAAIGEAAATGKCGSFDSCLKNAANPYRKSDPAVKYFSDCADLPFNLRAYFAWHNKLPFSYVNDVTPVDKGSKDIRYSANGNKVHGRLDIVIQKSGSFPQGPSVLKTLSDSLSSAMLRFDPRLDDEKFFTDLYPMKLGRDSVRPGSVIYDPNGHVAVVWRVESDGRVLFIDAHPDNSLTHGTYGAKFARSRPGMGAGFKNWRPIRLVGATKDSEGNLIGGRVFAARNAEIADYSVEQFFGNKPDASGAWNKGRFVLDGKTYEYYDFVRHALAQGELKYEPETELKNMLEALCQDLRDRVTAVQLAVSKDIHRKAHPERLPNNIYGTDGEWEEYSSPSRDARLKTSFKEARDRVEDFEKLFEARDPSIVFNGGNLRRDLLAVYHQVADACRISYKKSDGSEKQLDLTEAMHRIFALSFDPYHCPELRWGATDAAELASCADSQNKREWYRGEQSLRNQLERTYDVPMGVNLQELFTNPNVNRVKNAPDVDLEKYLSK